jgi:hypothetical protein
MKKYIQYSILYFLLLGLSATIFCQEKKLNAVDGQQKETLYLKYKKEVQAYSKKDYDAMFFEFFQKKNDSKITFTKEEYYTYTIKIAIYAEKLGLLYRDQKAEAQRTKQEWFDKNYQDYLNSKK